MHLINMLLLKQLPSYYKSGHAHIIRVVGQLTYLMFSKKVFVSVYLHHKNLAITNYDSLLCIVLEDLYE